MKITPTVGRVVWFYPSTRTGSTDFSPPAAGQPLAAVVAAVLAGQAVDVVNLTVFDAVGNPHSRTMVPLIQEGQDVPVEDGYYATWMPYQVEQAKKHAGELARADEPKAPGLPPHQQRVIDEKRELDEKLTKLEAFFGTPIFAGLDEGEKSRLERQEEAMVSYSRILGERIAVFQAAASTTV